MGEGNTATEEIVSGDSIELDGCEPSADEAEENTNPGIVMGLINVYLVDGAKLRFPICSGSDETLAKGAEQICSQAAIKGFAYNDPKTGSHIVHGATAIDKVTFSSIGRTWWV